MTASRDKATGNGTASHRSEVANQAARQLIDSRRLFYFYHVARLGSFTTAETVLDIAQPAMSRQIQLLEAEMGARLLERNSRGVSLTPIGALVYRQAESILADMSRTRIEVDLAINRPAGQISLAAPTFFVRAFMPEVMLRFHQTYPEVGLRVVESSTGHVSEMMAAGEVDLAVVLQAPNSARIKTEALISEHMDLCVSTTHEWATRTHAARSELDGKSFCLAANPHGSRMLIERWCQNGGIQLDVKLEMDSFFLMKLAIRTLPIFSFIPSTDIEPGDDLASIPLDPPVVRTQYLAYLRDRKHPLIAPLIREIRSALKARLDRQGARSHTRISRTRKARST